MILVADSGSTKTKWCLSDSNGTFDSCRTSGINPFLQSENDIYETLDKQFTLITGDFESIHFYGAGCINPEINNKVMRSLDKFFSAREIFVYSDLMGAARSLFDDQPGIVVILGTGSNSCYYDGNCIISNVSPLGYILGDEGSGAVLGRKLLSGVLKKQLPEDLCKKFFDKYNLSPLRIMENIYQKPFPNRFMARFTCFLRENIVHPSIHQLINISFKEFFTVNIKQYPEASYLPVNATGSVAWHFRKILEESARETGFHINKVTISPIDDLLKFHLSRLR